MRILLLVISILMSISCSRKEVNVREHLQNIPEAQVDTFSQQEEMQTGNSLYQNRIELYKVIESKNSAKADEALKLYFKEYVQKIFFTENSYSGEVKSAITDIINQLIMISSQKESYKEELFKVVFKGCDETMQGCVKYRLYPKTRSSLALIIEDIKGKEFTALSSARLLYVLQEHRGTPDPELFLLIMENQDELNKYLREHKSLKNDGDSIVDIAIRQVKSKSESSPEFKERYCESALESDVVESLESPLKTYSQKEKTLEIMVYCRQDMGSIYEAFSKRLQSEVDGEEISFLSRYRKLPASFFTRFEVEKDLMTIAGEKGSLELFVLDRYFNERLPLSVSFDLIKKFGKLDDSKFLKLFDVYIRSFFAFRSETSFDSLAEELKKSIITHDGLSSSTLVDVTQNVAKKNFELWVEATEKFGRLGGLINQLFATKVRSNLTDESRALYFSLIKRLKKEDFEETVKQNVEQPMQLFLNYYLSLLKGQAKFYFSWSNSVDKYASFDVRESLVNFINPSPTAGSIQSSYAYFQFTGTGSLRLTPLKVKTAFYKAAKLGLFDKISFDIEDIKNQVAPDYVKNVGLLIDRLYDHALQASVLSSNTQKYRKLERKYLARGEDGIKNIRKYCQNPFDSFFEAELSGLNTRVSLFSNTESDKAPLVFSAYGDAVSTDYWKNWVAKRKRMRSFADLIALARPEHAEAIQKHALGELKKYEVPLIKTAVLKKKLKDEILGTGCLKKVVEIERFKTQFLYEGLDSFFKQIYLVSNVSKLLKNKDTVSRIDIENSINKFSVNENLEEQIEMLKGQVKFLFESTETKELFESLRAGTELNKKDLQGFLRASLSPHNRSEIGNSIGFEVAGVPTVKNSKNFILQNFINIVGDTVTFSKWDLYIKTRHLMQFSEYSGESAGSIWPEEGPLFTQLLFDLGGQRNIESTSSNYGKKKIDLDFTINYDEFMKKIKREVFGLDQGTYLTWFKPNGSATGEKVKLYEQTYKALLNNFKIGAVPLTENWVEECFDGQKNKLLGHSLNFTSNNKNSACKVDRASSEEVISEFINFVSFLRMKESDLFVLDDLGSQSIYGENAAKYLKVTSMKSHEWRWFDNLYYLNFATIKYQSRTGIPVVIDSTPYGSEITRFINEVEATLKEKNHIIYHEDVYQYLRDEVRMSHFEFMDKILRIENAIFKVEETQELGEVPIELAVTKKDKEILVPAETVFPNARMTGEFRVLRTPKLGENGTEYLSRGSGPYKIFWANYKLFYEKQSDCFLVPRKNDIDGAYFSDFNLGNKRCADVSRKFINKLRENERGFSGLVENL